MSDQNNNKNYEVSENGKKRYLKATITDIIFSILLPFWGIVIGLFALTKGEKKRAGTMIGLGFIFVLFFMVLRTVQINQNESTLNTQQTKSELQQVADAINRKTPVMIDEITRLEKVTIGPGLIITYVYTLINIDASEVDASVFKKDFIPSITTSACNSSQLKPFFENNIGVYFEYRGKNNKQIGLIPLSKFICS